MKYFHNDIWRMDWGLGNPNKTAALIALLLIAVWAFAYIWKRGLYTAALLSAALSICLAHTFSRGGVIAWAIGSIPVICCARRPWKVKYVVAIMLVLLTFLISFFTLKAHERYVEAAKGEDRSVNNRLVLWKAAPRMMVDSPEGWGIGESGNAFMRWYQPLDCFERYRTLVNSHLTWLVELKWIFRLLYIAGWSTIIALCWPPPGKPYFSIALGSWICLGTAASFSSVAECKLLWIIPLILLLLVLWSHLKARTFPAKLMLYGSISAILTFAFIVLISGRDNQYIRKTSKGLFLGSSKPELWVIIEEERLLVSRGTAKTIRAYLSHEDSKIHNIGILQNAVNLPTEIKDSTVIIYDSSINTLKEITLRKEPPSKTILVSPRFNPWEYTKFNSSNSVIRVIFGEFSQSPFLAAWRGHENLHIIPATNEYFPDFSKVLFEI